MSFMLRGSLVSLLTLLASETWSATGDVVAVWEITHSRVAALSPSQKVPMRDKDGRILHTFSGADLQSFENVYSRISATTGFTGAHLLIKEDRSLNAFAAHAKNGVPIVVFTSGMMEVVHGDPDAIAAVMAHEFGHQVLHHQGYAGTTQAINLATQLLDAVVANSHANQKNKVVAASVGGLAIQGSLRSFDRDQERAADEFGIKNMIQAGFNPEGAIRLWQLPQMQGGGWLSTHPSSSERLQDVRRYAQQYAYLTPASAPEPKTRAENATQAAKANPLADASARIRGTHRANCQDDELRSYYKKSTCFVNEITGDQLTDASKATADELPVIKKARTEIAEANRQMANAYRKYGGDKGERLAVAYEEFDRGCEEATLNLYSQRSSWGEYNSRLRELSLHLSDQYAKIRGAK